MKGLIVASVATLLQGVEGFGIDRSARSRADRYKDEQPQPFPNSEECQDLHDCYNCTLSNCEWENYQCTGAKTGEANPKVLFSYSKVCGDPLQLCMVNDETSHYLYKHYQMSKLEAGKTFPWGYYCTLRIQANQHRSLRAVDNESLVNQRYGLILKGSKGKEYLIAANKYVAYDENKNLVEKEEILRDHQIRSAFEDDGAMLTFEPGTVQLDFGFINTVQRTLTPEDMLFNFDIFLMDDKQMNAVL